MSAALKWFLTNGIVRLLGEPALAVFNLRRVRPVSHWNHPSRGGLVYRWEVEMRLPQQVEAMHRLWKRTENELENLPNGIGGVPVNSLLGLRANLRDALGLPAAGVHCRADESSFLLAIARNPDDLTTWGGYADYLQELPEAHCRRRGELIAGWLHPKKALKTKYGMPLLAIMPK